MGGSSGGKSSGAVNYPTYMKETQHNWLTGSAGNTFITDGGEPMTYSVVALMNAAHAAGMVTLTNSPYNGITDFNPDNVMMAAGADYSTYQGQSPFKLLELSLAETPESLYTTYASDAAFTAMVAAYTSDLDGAYADPIVDSYNKGYSDLNADMSSAYTAGLVGVLAQKTRESTKFTLEMQSLIAVQRVQMKMEWRRLLSVLSVQNAGIYLIAKNEETETNAKYTADNALWDLEVYQYGTQVMASIAGSASRKSRSSKPSALGATVSGAATGATIGGSAGGPVGAAYGAIIGGILGYASTL